MGVNTKVTPSATPPVECLSTVGRVMPSSGRVCPESTIARVSARVSSASRPLMNAAIRKAAAR